ncbi:MAG: universal stress protein [Ginsengibacter sp.]
MKNILVPTDFSLNANKALDFAVQIAKQANAEIHLIHSCDLIDTIFKDNQAMYKEHNQTISDKANENLSLLKKSIEDTEKLSVHTKLYKDKITDAILQASDEHHADLIIMGTLGEAGLRDKIFGSITAEIVGKTNIPVMAVPLMSEWEIPEKIFLAVNNVDDQPALFKSLFDLAELFNATVHLGIFTDADTAGPINYLNDERGIIAYEEKLNTLFKNSIIKHVHLDGHTFQETLEQYILEKGIDIMAMLTHKRTFVESIFNRSMTKKMSYHTRISLLAIPA